MSRGRYPRRIKVQPPNDEVAKRFLLQWNSLDLFRQLESFPKITSRTMFANDKPLVLEVGCGTGEFLCNLASQRQDLNCLGVDVSIKRLFKAVATASTLDVENIRFIRADIKLTYSLWDHNSLQAVILHFPVPNVRGRYRKKRIFDQDFLDTVHHALVVGGLLSVKTDNHGYFSEMEKMVARDSRFEKISEDELFFVSHARFVSHNQRVWEMRGRPTLHFEIRKI